MHKLLFFQLFILFFPVYSFAQIGVNTDAPQAVLDIEGDLRISPSYTSNVPTQNLTESSQLYVDRSSGVVSYAPSGFTRVVGGSRPGSSNTLFTFPINNTLALVRFVFYVHKSNVTNNNQKEAYVYGDFKVIGTGPTDSIKFLDLNISNYLGNDKALQVVNDSTITWTNAALGTTTLSLDRTSGNFNIKSGQPVFSYFFEILGGI